MRILLISLLVLLVGAPPAFAQSNLGPDLGPDYVQTQFGPMGPAGRDLLQKVTLAGLWEGPAGRMALEKSANPKVQEAGRHLIEGHADLDRRTVELARTLNVTLPTQPNESQQGWLNEMQAAPARSTEFDKVFANRLRAAHGVVYKFLATVRTGTRNTAIRDYAKVCMDTVLDHMTVLEATGMVDFSDTDAIPLALVAQPSSSAAPTPPRAPQVVTQNTGQRQNDEGGIPDGLIGLAVMAAVVAGIWLWTGGRSSRRMHP
jgi:predicted outer membrane protein